MKFTATKIIDSLCEGQTTDKKVLEKILKLSKKSEKSQLSIALEGLIKLGIIERNNEGQLNYSFDQSLIKARLRCSSKGYCFALRDDGGEDIYIRDHNLNHAWNGDRVLVRITRDGIRRRSPEGVVQCILNRNSRNIIGIVESYEDNIIAVPLDDRLLATINLPDTDKSFIAEGDDKNVVEIKIDSYPIAQYGAHGHVERALTLFGGAKGDREIVVAKNNLQDSDSPPKVSPKTPSSKNRIDLTDKDVLLLSSWQNKDAPPLPAINIESYSGGFRVWIHSPSIAERIVIGNSLDLFLKERAEAHCIGQVWKPLLTNSLLNDAKFVIGKQNDAVSLLMDINAEGQVTDWQFSLTKIKPVAQINPEIMEAIATRKPKARTIPIKLKPYKDQISQVQSIIFASNLLNEYEKKNGKIELNLPILKIDSLSEIAWQEADNTRNQWSLPIDNTDPNSILSSFIRSANICWNIHANDYKLEGVSVEPQEIDIASLNDVARNVVSLELPIQLDEGGSPSASDLTKAFKDSDKRRVLDKQLKHAIPDPLICLHKFSREKNRNFNEELKSEEPIIPSQTPWCCPGNHYIDILNQHVIVSLLNEGKNKANNRTKAKIDLGKKGTNEDVDWPIFKDSILASLSDLFKNSLIHHLNEERRKSSEVRNDIISIAQAREAEPYIGKETEGVISGVQSYGFFVEIPPANVEGLVHVSSLNDDWYEYRSRQNRLVGRKNRRVYQLGEKVMVRILKVDVLRNQIDLELNIDSVEDKPSNDNSEESVDPKINLEQN